MDPTTLEVVGTAVFAVAVVHTFLVSMFQKFAHRFPSGSLGENVFHLLGEVEAVFGLWSAILLLYIVISQGSASAVEYLEGRNFTEPLFVFAIMTVAATRPVIQAAETLIQRLSGLARGFEAPLFFWLALVIGPLLGSFITEPAAITVTALVLKEQFFDRSVSMKFKYLTLAILLVNVSIGGTLTHFAAPPVLMVASTWNWDMDFMIGHFGWKAAIAVILNTTIALGLLLGELKKFRLSNSDRQRRSPFLLTLIHAGFLALIVSSAHHSVVFMGVLLLFLAVASVTREYQSPLKLKESMMVAAFLGGLVVLGGFQSWWLGPLLSSMSEGAIYVGAALLTTITDNAALTYLGAQAGTLTDTMKYFLVAGAVVGGGMTVIANAPNPAAFSILQDKFGRDRVKPVRLAIHALWPTVIAGLCFWFLPNL